MNVPQLREFESRILSQWEAGELPTHIHLCGGNEKQLIEIFSEIKPGDWIFSTHRNHYHALLAGIPPERLEGLIHFGRSMYVFDRSRNFLSTAILAGLTCPAVGVALDLQRTNSSGHVWCFLGDGAEEEGHFYEAALFAEARGLPVTFVIEDNDYQMETTKTERRGHEEHVLGPLDHFSCVRRYHYRRIYPHSGSGAAPGSIIFKPEAIARMPAA